MLTLLLLLAAPDAGTLDEQFARASEGCMRDMAQCDLRARLKVQIDARNDAASDLRYQQEQAARAQLIEEARVEAEKEQLRLDAQKAKCGKDFNRIKVGMRVSRLRECSYGEFEVVAEDQRGQVLQGPSATVRVERGVVVKWVAR